MSNNTEQILKTAKFNQNLAIEIYCELYIYNHYSESEIGIDYKSFGYKDDILPNENESKTWLENLRYRLNSIFRRRGISIKIDIEDVEDIIRNQNEFVPNFT